MAVVFDNNIKVYIGADVLPADLTITVGAGEGAFLPTIPVGDHMYATLVTAGTYGTDAEVLEIVRITDITGDVLTVERGVDGTVAQAFAVSDILEGRANRQLLLDLVPTVSETKERNYLDTFILGMQNVTDYPDVATLRRKNETNADNLISNWDTRWGSKVKVLIINKDTGEHWDDLSFPTLNDLMAWKTANMTTTGGFSDHTVEAHVYEEIDPTIPVIDNLYPMNRFLSSLKGKKRYGRSYASAALADSSMNNRVATIINAVLGTAFTGAEANLKGMLWLSRANKNKYAIPPFKAGGVYKMDMSSGNTDRYVWNGATIVSNNTERYENVNASGMVYVGLSTGLGLSIGFTWIEALEMLKNGDSVAMAVEMRGTTTPTHRAVAFKPLGIDMLVFSSPDLNTYDLEFVYLNNKKTSYINLKTMTPADIGLLSGQEIDLVGGKIRLTSDYWVTPDTGRAGTYAAMKNVNDLEWDRVYFRLRNRTTGAVGRLSYAFVEGEKRDTHTIVPFRFMLKNK